MGWLEGVLTGYAGRHYKILEEKRHDAEIAAKREQDVLQTLLESKYPDVKNYAAAAMLDLSNPRRRSGGVAGWMGEIDKSPYLPMIQRAQEQIASDPAYARAQLKGDPFYDLDEEGGAVPTTPSIPTPAGHVPGAAPGQPSAALPSTSQVTGTPGTPPTPAPPPPPPMGRPNVSFGGGGSTGFGRPTASFRPGARPSTQLPTSSAPYYDPISGRMISEGRPQPVPMPAPPPGLAEPGTPVPMPSPPAGLAQPGTPVPMPAGPPGLAGAGPPPSPAGPPLPVSSAPPPPPGQVSPGMPGATTGQVGRLPPPRPSRTQLPGIFPTAAELARDKQQSDIQGEVQGWQYLYRQMGEPDWQKKGIEAVLAQKRGALGSNLREGNARQLPDGTWVQDLYDPYTGKVVNSIPSPGPLGAGAVQTREAIAFRRYGKQGENPRDTIRRLSPAQMARVMEEERDEKAITAAEVALARAQAMADAPLSAQAKSQLIEALNTKWQRLQESPREMVRQFGLMQTGLKRFQEGDRLGGAQAILVTFQKMLDPISVVRESEYARSSSGLSLLGQLEGWWDKLKAGGAGVPVAEMEQMVETARQFLEGMQGWNDTERARIEDRATGHGIDPGFIFGGGLRTPTPATPSPATPSPATPSPPPPPPGRSPAGPAGWTVDKDGNLFDPQGVKR